MKGPDLSKGIISTSLPKNEELSEFWFRSGWKTREVGCHYGCLVFLGMVI